MGSVEFLTLFSLTMSSSMIKDIKQQLLKRPTHAHTHTHTHAGKLTSGVSQSSNIHRHSLSLFPLNPAKIYQPNVTTSENLYAICIIPAAAVKFRTKQIAQGKETEVEVPSGTFLSQTRSRIRVRIPIAGVFIWGLRISELCA